jgi:hypothetical protein
MAIGFTTLPIALGGEPVKPPATESDKNSAGREIPENDAGSSMKPE